MNSYDFIYTRLDDIEHIECIIEQDRKSYTVFFKTLSNLHAYINSCELSVSVKEKLVEVIESNCPTDVTAYGVNLAYWHQYKIYFKTAKQISGINLDLVSLEPIEYKTYTAINAQTIEKVSDVENSKYYIDPLLSTNILGTSRVDMSVLGARSDKNRTYWLFNSSSIEANKDIIKVFMDSVDNK